MGWAFRDEQTESAFYERAYAKVNAIGWGEEEQIEYIEGFIEEYFLHFQNIAQYPEMGSVLFGPYRKAPKPSGKDRGAVVIYERDKSGNILIVSITSFLT